jgi:hypothetical protein
MGEGRRVEAGGPGRSLIMVRVLAVLGFELRASCLLGQSSQWFFKFSQSRNLKSELLQNLKLFHS